MDVSGPVGGVDYPRTLQEFRGWFPDDASCLTYLEGLRWGEGFFCPACAHDEAWRTSRGLRMCTACGRKSSVTAGTIFHRSHTPMSTWFAAVWLITSSKTGISANNVQAQLGFGSYETAWAWLHKLRRAMVRPDRDLLQGIVEVDETFLGGQSPMKAGASTDKVPVRVAVEKIGHRSLGRVRFEVADGPGNLGLVDFACAVVEPGSLIRTDGARMLRRLGDLGYTHEYANGYASEDRSQELPGVHLVASLLKRWTAGTLQHRMTERHLPYYLDEFAFRFNRRTSTARGLLFYRLLQQAVNTDPHPLKDLIGGG